MKYLLRRCDESEPNRKRLIIWQSRRIKIQFFFMWHSCHIENITSRTNRNLWHLITFYKPLFFGIWCLWRRRLNFTLHTQICLFLISFQMSNTMKYSSTPCLTNRRLLVIVLLVIAVSARSDGQQPPELTDEEIAEILHDVEPQIYCSRKLNMVMKQVCMYKEKFLKNKNSKKSCKLNVVEWFLDEIFTLNSHIPDNNDLEFDGMGFDVDRIGAGSYDDYLADTYSVIPASQRGYRSPRGIIDECCKQPCHKYQLIKYCTRHHG